MSSDAPVGIMGYSQGGHASAFAAELQAKYAPALNVKGVASGAVPANVTEIYGRTNGGPFGGLISFVLIGLNAAYPDLNLPSILTSYGQSVMADARGTKCIADMITSYPFLSDAVLVQAPAMLNRPDWQARMAQNQAGTGVPAVPALVYAGALDEMVPYSQNRSLPGARAAAISRSGPSASPTTPLAWPSAGRWR